MEKPDGFLELKVFRLNKILNIWEDAEIIIDFNLLFFEYIENFEVEIKRKTLNIVRAKLNTGKIIYIKSSLNDFKNIYYALIISIKNATVEPLSTN